MNQGIIEQLSDSQTLYNHPNTKFVAGFIGEANLIQVNIDTKTTFRFDDKTFHFNHEISENRGTLFIRPENVSFDIIHDISLQVTIEDVIFVGNHRKYKLVTPSGQKIIKTEDSSVALTKVIGQTVTIYLSASLIQIYNS